MSLSSGGFSASIIRHRSVPLTISRTDIASRPSEYEQHAIRKLARSQRPDRSWLASIRSRVNTAYNDLTEQLRRVPGFEWTVDHVISGVLRLINEITQDWIWVDAVLKEYRQGGHRVAGLADIRSLDLEAVDRATESLRKKYSTLSAAEGAATGAAGAAGMVTDIVALVALNLRAAGEYATYHGMDVTRDTERLYALSILDRVARPSSQAKDFTLAPIVRISKRIARQQSLELLEQAAVSKAIQNISRSIGVNLTKAKLAQIMPVAGAVVGGTFNAYYTHKVCRTASQAYRRRFLVNKYGEAVVSRLEREATAA